MTKVLSGIRVLEQGTFITGPCAAMLLADLGADVIKVEGPGTGDPYRTFGEGHYSAHFQAYNRNKRAISLDLKQSSDVAVLHDLVRSADVYIQNFRPGAAARIGADPTTLTGINPKLVYCSISGFGSSGPYVGRPSYDTVAQALSGFMGVAIDCDEPRILGPALADAITGLYAAMGTMGALVERGRTGVGRVVEVSMLEAMMHFAVEPFTGYLDYKVEPTSLDRPRIAQAYVLRTRDGKLVCLHLSSVEKFWTNLTAAVEAPELAVDPRFAGRNARIANYPVLEQILAATFKEKASAEWVEIFRQYDIPFATVNSIHEALNDPQAKFNEIEVPVERYTEGAATAIRPAFNFDGARATSVIAAPKIDEHGAQIRAELDRTPGAWPAAV